MRHLWLHAAARLQGGAARTVSVRLECFSLNAEPMAAAINGCASATAAFHETAEAAQWGGVATVEGIKGGPKPR